MKHLGQKRVASILFCVPHNPFLVDGNGGCLVCEAVGQAKEDCAKRLEASANHAEARVDKWANHAGLAVLSHEAKILRRQATAIRKGITATTADLMVGGVQEVSELRTLMQAIMSARKELDTPHRTNSSHDDLMRRNLTAWKILFDVSKD